MSQLLVVVGLVFFLWYITTNLLHNIDKRGITTGFDFFGDTAGFAISESFIFYDDTSTYFRAFLVGLVNTLVVSFIGIVFSTIIGVIIGLSRLSKNYLVSKLSLFYIEFFRNIPILLQILFWYNLVLVALPSPRQSIDIVSILFLNNRGFYLPTINFDGGLYLFLISLFVGFVVIYFTSKYYKRRFEKTGIKKRLWHINISIIVLLLLIVYNLTPYSINFDIPILKGFNLQGGTSVSPEFLALTFALSIYTATYIAEAIRSGIQAIPKGQIEAGYSLGFSLNNIIKLIILPQAFRISIPPIISQYLNLLKNSSLATAIGYPDLVTVFSGTVLNQTGQAIEIIFITMLVYLTISLTISFVLNIINKKMQLKGR